MPGRIREIPMLEPYCDECPDAGDDGTTVRREAEAWVAKHDAEFHPEPEEEDA